jgi:hypothetical protein
MVNSLLTTQIALLDGGPILFEGIGAAASARCGSLLSLCGHPFNVTDYLEMITRLEALLVLFGRDRSCFSQAVWPKQL